MIGAASLAILLAGAPSGSATVPLADDLRRDSMEAARHGTALILLFSLPDCAYCHVVRRNYLAPLTQARPDSPRYVVREVVLQSRRAMTGLDGKRTTHAEVARFFGVRVAPTVMFVDRSGSALAAPLVGGDTAGMYGAYLASRLADARARLIQSTQTGNLLQ